MDTRGVFLYEFYLICKIFINLAIKKFLYIENYRLICYNDLVGGIYYGIFFSALYKKDR